MPDADRENAVPVADASAVGVIGTGAVAFASALASTSLRAVVFGAHAPPESLALLTGPSTTEVTSDHGRLSALDTIVIAEPVTLTPSRGADLTALGATARTVADRLRRGQLIVLAGSVPPGTTREVMLPLLARSGLAPGRDFFLTHVAAPNARSDRVVGGFDEASARAASALFTRADFGVTQVTSLEAAELCGAAGAAARIIQTAATNELRWACDRMGIDVREVLAATGISACEEIPGDDTIAALLSWGARRWNASFRLLDSAVEINTGMTEYLIEKVTDALNGVGKAVRGSRVAILGVTSKKDAGALREWLNVEVLVRLVTKGAHVTYNDPRVSRLPQSDRWPRLGPMESQPLTAEYLAAQDCVLVAAHHASYHYDFIVQHSQLVVDTRNATKTVT